MLQPTILFFSFLFISSSYGQNALFEQIKPNFDKRLEIHYTRDELQNLQETNPEKLELINYYYTKSYRIEMIPMEETIPFDLNSFDIFIYEKERDRVLEKMVTDYKRGIRIFLTPINELQFKLPIHLEIDPIETDED
jgi:ribosome biogenesis GTPase A